MRFFEGIYYGFKWVFDYGFTGFFDRSFHTGHTIGRIMCDFLLVLFVIIVIMATIKNLKEQFNDQKDKITGGEV